MIVYISTVHQDCLGPIYILKTACAQESKVSLSEVNDFIVKFTFRGKDVVDHSAL